MGYKTASPDRYGLLKAYAREKLEQMGYHVMRFTNEEVLNDKEYVVEQIESYFK